MHNSLTVLFILTFAFLACIATTIPREGRNDHYTEDKSQSVRMDSNKRPTLVDLFEKDNPAVSYGPLNKYLLFTRSNPFQPDLLIYQDEESIRNSNFKPGLPVTFIAHGWGNSKDSEVNTYIKSALLDTSEINVITLDWTIAAALSYTRAVDAVVSVGEYLGLFINWFLAVTGTSPNDVTLVGHSLGAHVVGKAGRMANGKLAKVIGLDPAGPMWSINPEKLNTSSGKHVEMISTDGGFLGYYYPLGHANFYPNRGKSAQPGCWLNICSHSFAYRLYAASICYDRFVGRKCKNLDEVNNNTCSGEELMMGSSKLGEGLYGLRTEAQWPFIKIDSYDIDDTKKFCNTGLSREVSRTGRPVAQRHYSKFARPRYIRRRRTMRYQGD